MKLYYTIYHVLHEYCSIFLKYFKNEIIYPLYDYKNPKKILKKSKKNIKKSKKKLFYKSYAKINLTLSILKYFERFFEIIKILSKIITFWIHFEKKSHQLF